MMPASCAAATACADLNADMQRLSHVDRAAIEHRAQRYAVNVFGGEELRAVGVSDIVDGEDVGVIERGNGTGLALEAAQPLFVRQRPMREHLQRQPAAEPDVLGEVDLRHAARPEWLQHPIVGQQVAGAENPLHAFTRVYHRVF